ncbi:hypothetical protein [Arcanobacterium phocae]|uniref:hypothetical protein n=1 Tax=Arcanobacterium phocae TaxID=131112 RepID=UPI001C0EAFCA|nr:hypothetical protein [Arcanobacterium phocae]
MTILNYSSRSALVLTIAGLSITSTAGIASATSDTQIDKKCEQARMAIAEENKKIEQLTQLKVQLEKRVAEEKAQRATLQEALAKLSQDSNKEVATATELTKKISVANKIIDSTKVELAEIEEQSTVTTLKLNEAKKALAEAIAKRDNAKKNFDAAVVDAASKKSGLDTATQKTAQAEDATKVAREKRNQALAIVQEKINKLTGELNQAKKQEETAQSTAEKARTVYEEAQTATKNEVAKLNQLRNAKETAAKEIDSAFDKIQQGFKEKSQQIEKINNLKKEELLRAEELNQAKNKQKAIDYKSLQDQLLKNTSSPERSSLRIKQELLERNEKDVRKYENEVKELSKKLQETPNDDILKLRKNGAENNLAEARNDVKELQSEVQILAEKVASLDGTKVIIEAKLKQYDEVTGLIRQLTLQVGQISLSIYEQKEQLTQIEQNIASLQIHQANLLTQQTERNRDIQTSERQLANLQKKQNTAKSTLDKVEQDLVTVAKEKNALEKKLNEVRKQVDDSELRKAERTLTAAKDDLAKAKEDHAAATKNAEVAQQALTQAEANIKATQQILDEQFQKLTQLGNKQNELQAKLDMLTHEVVLLNKDLKLSETRREELSKKIADTESLLKQVKDSTEELAKATLDLNTANMLMKEAEKTQKNSCAPKADQSHTNITPESPVAPRPLPQMGKHKQQNNGLAQTGVSTQEALFASATLAGLGALALVMPRRRRDAN